MALDAALASLAQAFRINLLSSNPATRSFSAQLLAPPGGEGPLSVTDLVTSTQIVPAPLSLSWLVKDVRFGNTNISDLTTLGGQPINDLLALNVGNVTNGPPNPPGVPGLLGAITGNLPIPIDVTTATSVLVSVDVRWRITDGAGNTVSDVQFSLGGSPPFAGSGGDIAPPPGRALEALNLLFDLIFGELTADLVPIAARNINAAVRLTAGSVSTGFIDLPPLPLQLPIIPVPTIAIFCQDDTFRSNKLVVVPGNSPLDQATVSAAINTLAGLLDPLRSTFSFLGFFLDAAATVSGLLASGSISAFRKADFINNLNDIDLESGFFNDTEAEDELSSMLLLGPPRRHIECYNARNLSTSEGQMNLSVDRLLLAQVANLHSPSPASDPPGRVAVPVSPHGGGIFSSVTSFGDEFSSLRFGFDP